MRSSSPRCSGHAVAPAGAGRCSLRASALKRAALPWLLPLLALQQSSSCQASPGDERVAELRDWVVQHGYPFEAHDARTDDGVLLGLFRLPQPGAPAVHLHHGILDSAWCWVFNREFKALAFQLHDAGYDVWLGNSRGTGFSDRWADGSSARQDRSFWNFTFDTMARRDVPTIIDTIVNATGQQTIAWVGHSQGTTQVLIAASEPGLREAVADRLSVLVALSPVAWVGHSDSMLLRLLADTGIQSTLWPLFPYGFLESDGWRRAARLLCQVTLGTVCNVGLGLICGHGSMNSKQNVDAYAAHFPFGTSYMDVVHFGQAMAKGTFQRFDYGPRQNVQAYGSPHPPAYDLGQMRVPVALLMGDSDSLVDPKDAERLAEALQPSGQVFFARRYAGFAHATWTLGAKEAGYYVEDVLGALRSKHPPAARELHV